MKTSILFPIRYVAGQTGLSQHVIRVWERRYGVVAPERTDTNWRLYSESDIKRLQLLKKAVDSGHSISLVARMNSDELIRLINRGKKNSAMPNALNPGTRGSLEASYFCEVSMAKIIELDAAGLEAVLSEAAVHLTRPKLIKALIVPLCREMGDLWKKGNLKIVHEHLATPVIRAFLWNMLRSADAAKSAPKIVIATPLGQPHELGALTIALIASESGWRPLYFGPSLPAAEIAAAVTYSGASAVGLSLTNRSDHHLLKIELMNLRGYLSEEVTIFVGGQIAANFADFCESLNIIWPEDIDTFRLALETLPNSPPCRDNLRQD